MDVDDMNRYLEMMTEATQLDIAALPYARCRPYHIE